MVFWCTSARVRHRCSQVPSLQGLPPSSLCIAPLLQELSTGPLFESPGSHSRFPLAVCFTCGIVGFHIALCIRLTLSLLHSPMSMGLFSVSFSIASLKVNSSVPSFWIPCMCVSIWCLYFSFCLTSLCAMGSRFVQLIGTDSNAFLFMTDGIPLYICTTASFPVHLWMDI